MPRLPLLRAVVQETMRLYPGAWLHLRSNLAEDEVRGVRVAAGSRVIVSAYATHRLPSLGEEPDAFRPERFLESAPARPRFAYLPFGGGGRQCIGDVFALTEGMVVAAVVLQRHRLRQAPGYAVRLQRRRLEGGLAHVQGELPLVVLRPAVVGRGAGVVDLQVERGLDRPRGRACPAARRIQGQALGSSPLVRLQV